ncbi:UNVERIFIED_CONTAM: MLO-like protein 2 [Sesamum angustifolium]|uniref:MLO-like protein 2 n=1 Tax=Sesamum angustifolium TaxID=2727405 RepID=A0AAW2IP44_9LAMI
MAGASGGRSLEQTPTWAVAVVCFVLVAISIVIEHIIHLIGKWLQSKHKKALYEALEKLKSELMLLGFISLLLTVGQSPISNICISKSVGATWHPCSKKQEGKKYPAAGILERTTAGNFLWRRRMSAAAFGESWRQAELTNAQPRHE